MPNTSRNPDPPSPQTSTCPEDSVPRSDSATPPWSGTPATRTPSPSSMPELNPDLHAPLLPPDADAEPNSPATSRSATLSPGEGAAAVDEAEGCDTDDVRGKGWRGRREEGLDFREEGDGYSATSMGPDYADVRAITTSPSSYLRAGTRFQGAQSSERQKYIVSVEIKRVDLRESFLCGYLRIQDLTEDHPTLTTYFEGEILGQKHTFTTPHPSWGATPKDDLSHWSKFAAFRPYARAARKGPVFIRDLAQQEHIFMRWKERFLVPDHRVTTIRGASFEGFYYICFNQVKGEISGIYFHSKSERFQQLELKHVEDRGRFPSVEFR